MSANPEKNPYRPGAATPPRYLAGREQQLDRWPKLLRAAPEIPANLRVTGLRGVGKSVLLKELQSIAEREGWLAIRYQLEPRHNTESALTDLVGLLTSEAIEGLTKTRRLKARVSGVVEAGRRMATATLGEMTFSLAGMSDAERGIVDSLRAAATAALDSGRSGVVLLLDEAQTLRDETARTGEHPLSMLITAFNALQEQGLPVALVLCGLPNLRANLQKARTYSERMFRSETIGELTGNPGPARDAFVRPLAETGVVAEESLIERVLVEVEGYPFFIQLWGAELWEAAHDAGTTTFSTALLDEIESDIYRRLDEEFYAGRVEVLTPSEQDILLASADCDYPPLRTSEIRSHSDKSDGNINVLMGRLVEQGVIYRQSKGTYAFTAPKFHEYLTRRRTSVAR